METGTSSCYLSLPACSFPGRLSLLPCTGAASTKKASKGKDALVLSRPPHEPEDAGILLPLVGECFSFEDDRYQYELCPFQNVTQTELKRRSNAFVLGVWGEWVASGGAQRYSDGDVCGDINRSATVAIECGAPDFRFHRVSPALCALLFRRSPPYTPFQGLTCGLECRLPGPCPG